MERSERSTRRPLRQRLPGLVPVGDGITIKQLLNHTSGIFDFEHDDAIFRPYFAGHLEYHWSMRQLVKHAVAHKPLFAPGVRQSYSNTNYVLGGLVVEAVTGKTIGAELHSRIVQPLHLDSTMYPTNPGLPSPYAHGYMVFGNAPTSTSHASAPPSRRPPARSSAPPTTSPTSFAASSPDSYSAPTFCRRWRHPSQAAPNGYGLGLQRNTTSCGLAFGHDGGVAGYGTIALSSPDGRRQAVLMVNHDADTLTKRAKVLFDKLIAKAYCSANH